MLENFRRGSARLSSLFLSAWLVLATVGCSEPRELTTEQAVALEQRVRDRWQTLVNRDFDAAWEFETPNYRSVFSKSMYRQQFSYSVEWELTGVSILNYDAPAAVASVVARVMTKSTKPTSAATKAIGARPLSIREKWILIDGEWWHSVNY